MNCGIMLLPSARPPDIWRKRGLPGGVHRQHVLRRNLYHLEDLAEENLVGKITDEHDDERSSPTTGKTARMCYSSDVGAKWAC